MKRTALLSGVVLLLVAGAPALAQTPVTACGQSVTDGVLTGDLDCSAYEGIAVDARGSVDLAGFTLTGHPDHPAIQCGGTCTVRGPGVIRGADVGFLAYSEGVFHDYRSKFPTTTISNLRFEDNRTAIGVGWCIYQLLIDATEIDGGERAIATCQMHGCCNVTKTRITGSTLSNFVPSEMNPYGDASTFGINAVDIFASSLANVDTFRARRLKIVDSTVTGSSRFEAYQKVTVRDSQLDGCDTRACIEAPAVSLRGTGIHGVDGGGIRALRAMIGPGSEVTGQCSAADPSLDCAGVMACSASMRGSSCNTSRCLNQPLAEESCGSRCEVGSSLSLCSGD